MLDSPKVLPTLEARSPNSLPFKTTVDLNILLIAHVLKELMFISILSFKLFGSDRALGSRQNLFLFVKPNEYLRMSWDRHVTGPFFFLNR